MTLLELITKASSSPQTLNTTPPDYPVVLDPASIFPGLNPKPHEPDASAHPIPVTGWKISQKDSDRIELCKKFFAELEGKLKTPEKFAKDEFLRTLKSFLEALDGKLEPSAGSDPPDVGSVRVLIEKAGLSMGKDVAGLISEAGAVFEAWELVKTAIVNGLVGSSRYKTLVPRLVEKRRSDLLCLCVKHASDLGPPELLPILKHFLGSSSPEMEIVRKEWRELAVSAIEKAAAGGGGGKRVKEAAVLMMAAHDGFSSPELCLHYLLASGNVDEVVFTASVRRLDGRETTRLVRYLGKWLEKYERFPQASAAACDRVPKLEDIARCLGLVLDQSFSSLVLRTKFHAELCRLETLVASLASEARLCCSVANVAEKLKIEVQGT